MRKVKAVKQIINVLLRLNIKISYGSGQGRKSLPRAYKSI
jgi:hypothetical protein